MLQFKKHKIFLPDNVWDQWLEIKGDCLDSRPGVLKKPRVLNCDRKLGRIPQEELGLKVRWRKTVGWIVPPAQNPKAGSGSQSALFSLALFYLRRRERERSSMYWLTLQMPTTARARSGWSLKSIIQARTFRWLAETQVPGVFTCCPPHKVCISRNLGSKVEPETESALKPRHLDMGFGHSKKYPNWYTKCPLRISS